jgi:hypothetical protein
MRRHSQSSDIVHFEVDIGINQIVAEDTTRFQELAILIERAQGLVQREGNQLQLFLFLRWQVIQVFVHRITWVNLVLDSIKPGQHHRCKG